MASPIPFISWNAGAKEFVVEPKAVDVLGKLTGPVAVLAVCGRARQGKSFLLNQLLAKLGPNRGPTAHFKVAPTTKPCTKGLWLWSSPVQRTTPSGLTYNLVFLDCEGIDAFDQSKDYSTHVFSLAVLLSSLMIYNQLGSIDESSVEALGTVCEFSKLIRAQASTSQSFSWTSPSFLWLLRDFHLQLQDGSRTITPTAYMEEVLANKGQVGKDQIRTSIRDLFPERECVALVRPLSDEAALATMDALPLDRLRPEFKQGLDKLVTQVLARAAPKKMGGGYLSGRALVTLAQAYAGVLNKGQVPSLASTWQAVLSSENQRALDAALADYVQRMDAILAGAPAEELDARHELTLGAALAVFEAQALGDAAERASYVARLRTAATDRYNLSKGAVLAKTRARAEGLLAAGAMRLAPLMSRDPPDLDTLMHGLTEMLDDYDQQSKGCADRYKLAAEFLVNTIVKGCAEAAIRAMASSSAAQAKLQVAEKELIELRQRVALAEQRLGSARGDEANLRSQLATAQAAVEAARRTSEQRLRDVAGLEAQRDTAAASAQVLRNQIAGLESRLTAAQKDVTDARSGASATQQEAAAARATAAAAQQEAAAARAAATGAQQEAATARAAVAGAQQEAAAAQRDTAAARVEAATARQEVAAAQAAAAGARQEAAAARAEAGTGTRAADAAAADARQEAAEARQQAAEARAAAQLEVTSARAAAAAAQQEAAVAKQEAVGHVSDLMAQVTRLQRELELARAAGREVEARAALSEAEANRLQLQLQQQQHQQAVQQQQWQQQPPPPPAPPAQPQPPQQVVVAVVTAPTEEDQDMEDMNGGGGGEAGPSTGGRGRKRLRAVRTPEQAAGGGADGADGGSGRAAGGVRTPFSDEKEVVVRGGARAQRRREEAGRSLTR